MSSPRASQLKPNVAPPRSSLKGRVSISQKVLPVSESSVAFVIQFGNNSNMIRAFLRAAPLCKRFSPSLGDPQHRGGSTSFEKRTTTVSASQASEELTKKAICGVDFLWTQYRNRTFLDWMKGPFRASSLFVFRNQEAGCELKPLPEPKSAAGARPRRVFHNHFEHNEVLCTKIGLLESLKKALGAEKAFEIVPFSMVVKDAAGVKEFEEVLFSSQSTDSEDALAESTAGEESSTSSKGLKKSSKPKPPVWLLKPGGFANRGVGIKISEDTSYISAQLQKQVIEREKPYLLQRYIRDPLLVNGRKFDIRAYCMLVDNCGKANLTEDNRFRAFWFLPWYVRTTSVKYEEGDWSNRLKHLNNDAVQKKGESYGKFESANKLSVPEFQKYLDGNGYGKDATSMLSQKMKQISEKALAAAIKGGINKNEIGGCFEIFGLDFMVEKEKKGRKSLRPWLIEVNTNPCLELCNSHLAQIIPTLIETGIGMAVLGDFGVKGAGKWEDMKLETSEKI